MSRVFSNNLDSLSVTHAFNYIIPDDESKILAWLSPLEPWVRHQDIRAQRLDNIGSWLLETQEFRRWHKGSWEDEVNHPTLFCHGNPGAGKSHIISLVIDKLCDEAVEEDTAVACFYFDFAARNEQSPVNTLGSLLQQLVSGLEGIPEAVVRSFRNQKTVIGGRGLQVSEILKMFQTITATKRTFICIDALDECVPEHRTVILESLERIMRDSLNTRIFLTGRSHIRSEVERKLGGAAAFVLVKPTDDGIIGYLREKLRSDTTPEMMSSTLEANILKSISQISSETFLLASLHIQAILRETSIARRGKRLKAMKDGAGLGDAYGATLERIKAQGGERTKLAMAALMWICHAERLLQVDELRHALAVEIGATDFDSENAPSIGALLSCCQGLITVDKEASNVRVIHFTVQEYLCAQPDLFNQPHSVLAETCLTYLNSPQVKNLSSHPLPDHQIMPFLKYSSRHWGTHANREFSDYAAALALDLLNRYEDHVSAVSLLRQALPLNYVGGIGASPGFSGLHCASFFGIVELVALLTNTQGCEINQGDCGGYTPLLWAAKNGHDRVVKLLLERESVDPDRPDKQDRTPLSWAAENGHEGVVKLLLDRKDVDPSRPEKNNRTPLRYAALEGHEGVVRLLLGRADVDPNCPDDNDRTPLMCAAGSGHEGVVKLLLGREDVDPGRPDNQDITPISRAAEQGHEGVVKMLLEREYVNTGRADTKPLLWAAQHGHEGVVRMLLERADVDPGWADTQDDRTPLSWAAQHGHEGVVKMLLEREDADPDQADTKDGRTPLSRAAEHGHDGVAKMFLQREDVDPNRTDTICGRTPLSWAAEHGHDGVVKILLERENVNPDQADTLCGQTPLSWAAEHGHEEVVKLLLEREYVDPNRADIGSGRTPLSWAAEHGHEGVVKMLLEREDVNPNRADTRGGYTPLSWAARSGHEQVVKMLLERTDVHIDLRDKNQTPSLSPPPLGHDRVVIMLPQRDNTNPGTDRGSQTSLPLPPRHEGECVARMQFRGDHPNTDLADPSGQPLPYSPETHERPPPPTIESQKPTELRSPLSESLVTRLVAYCLRAPSIGRGPIQRRHLGRFRLWADEYNTPHGQLDEILKESPILREATTTLLADLCNILATRNSHPDGTPHTDRPPVLQEACTIYPGISQLFPGSDSDSGGEEDEIETIVDSLFNLSPLLADILENLPRDARTNADNNGKVTAVSEVAHKFDASAYASRLRISRFLLLGCLLLVYQMVAHREWFLMVLENLGPVWQERKKRQPFRCETV